jgi:stage II sporulation protein AB (anti-sigma F factor)
MKKANKHERNNSMRLEIEAKSCNESFARTVVAAFAAQLDPTIEEINDLKTAVSEAVTNCIVHAYDKANAGKIVIECELIGDTGNRGVAVTVTDFGIGIPNIEKALEPFYTTKPEQERSGMGFTVMQSFMTSMNVTSKTGETTIEMTKNFG